MSLCTDKVSGASKWLQQNSYFYWYFGKNQGYHSPLKGMILQTSMTCAYHLPLIEFCFDLILYKYVKWFQKDWTYKHDETKNNKATSIFGDTVWSLNKQIHFWKQLIIQLGTTKIEYNTLDHSWFGHNQWQMPLHCNIVSHWLSPYSHDPWQYNLILHTVLPWLRQIINQCSKYFIGHWVIRFVVFWCSVKFWSHKLRVLTNVKVFFTYFE